MGVKVGRFEDLEVWKEGMRLATKIYRALNTCRDYGLRDQMQRSAVSIPSNIAEGYERNTNKDFIGLCGIRYEDSFSNSVVSAGTFFQRPAVCQGSSK